MLNKTLYTIGLFLLFITLSASSNAQDNNPQYIAEIARADEAFASEEFEKAQKHYRKALEMKPGAKYPLYRLEDSRTLDEMKKARERKKDEEKVKNRDDEYKNAIKTGDREFKATHYNISKDAYLQALSIKHWEPYPKEQIEKINKILFQQKQDQEYQNAIDMADALFNAEEYYKSKDKYKEALSIKPDEQYPRQRIEKIDEILNYLRNKAAYDRAIAAADKLYYGKVYEDAKQGYEKALKILDKQYPKDQIRKINEILAEQNENYAYLLTIEEADKLFYAEKYLEAKPVYQKASNLEPTEEYPKEQIAKIDDILANQNKIAQYNALIEKADNLFSQERYTPAKNTYEEALAVFPNKQYPKDQIEKINRLLDLQNKEVVYNSIIQKADKLFNEKKYSPAKVAYQEALQIFPDKMYPKNQIEKINALLAAQNKDKLYDEMIAQADELFDHNSYIDSRSKYKEALTIKPREQYPKDRIAEIEKILAEQSKIAAYNEAIANADALFNEKSYSPAKNAYKYALEIIPEKKYPKDQITKIENILDAQNKLNAYNAAIQKADESFNTKQYNPAKTYYQEALTIFPEKEYPKEQIQKINELLEALAKNDKYTGIITEADKLFANKEYLDSKSKYQEALTIKPQEKYPQDQITKINQLLEEQQKINSYNQLIASADKLFNTKEYTLSKGKYNDALSIFPEKNYPKEQIQKIDRILSEQAKLEKYNQKIKDADLAFNQKNYIEARNLYNEALGIYAEKQYPKDQVEKINSILQKQQKEKDYEAIIAEADQLFDRKQYNNSKEKYQKALDIFNNKQYPKDQIAKIDNILSQLAIDQKYNSTIAQADKYFHSKQYKYALIAYKDASSIKPEEQYPNNQIAKINAILNAAKVVEEQKIDIPVVEYEDFDLDLAKADSLEIEKAYQKAIKKGKTSFLEKYYSAARFYFTKAHEFKPSEDYPVEQLALIEKEMKDILNNRNNKNYFDLLQRADRAFNDGYFAISEYYYLFALSVKPNETYPREKLKEIQKIISEKKKVEEKENNQ